VVAEEEMEELKKAQKELEAAIKELNKILAER